MTQGTVANGDGIEIAQARVCEAQAILQLASERLERIEEATDAWHAVHVAREMLESVYEQLQSLLEPEHARHEVMPFRRKSAPTAGD
jgi:hypothetical protein